MKTNFVTLFDIVFVRKYSVKSNEINIVYRILFKPTQKVMFITCVYERNEEPYTQNILIMLLHCQVTTWESSNKRFEMKNKQGLTFTQWCLWKRQMNTLRKVMEEYYSIFVNCRVLYNHKYKYKSKTLQDTLFISEIISLVDLTFLTYDMSISIYKLQEEYETILSLYIEEQIGNHLKTMFDHMIDVCHYIKNEKDVVLCV